MLPKVFMSYKHDVQRIDLIMFHNYKYHFYKYAVSHKDIRYLMFAFMTFRHIVYNVELKKKEIDSRFIDLKL